MKSYYVPCICWGKTAYSAASLSVGMRVGVVGRIQSREYDKRLDIFTVEKRIAYEVSVKNLAQGKMVYVKIGQGNGNSQLKAGRNETITYYCGK